MIKKQVLLFSASSLLTLGALLTFFPGEDPIPTPPRTVIIPGSPDAAKPGQLEGALGRIQAGADSLLAKTEDLRAAGSLAADKINGQVAEGLASALEKDGDLSPGDLKAIGQGVVAALPGAVDDVANALPIAKGEGLSGLKDSLASEAGSLKDEAIAAASEAARAAGRAITPSIKEAVKDGHISLEDASSVAGAVATEAPKASGGLSGLIGRLMGGEG